MRKLVYYVAVTLDGRIAGPQGEYDFYPQGDEEQAAAYSSWMNARCPETVPTVAREALGLADTPHASFDAVVMGLGAYRPALDEGITSPYAHLRQYVVSSTLAADIDPAVTVVAEDRWASYATSSGRRGGTSGSAEAGVSPVRCCARSTSCW
ncbi:hypothetical protein F558DRAFT_03219 [Streptomyces sp. AmelKG-A3]|nr:hypothetical protein GA0115247_108332 [Streptomyces sp. PalvLS-984]SDD06899.1 hypothetical protein F558DRAFT_03219 [Streptomyces sp. AmelKG-A3]